MTKIVCISDTHCRQSKLKIPRCDILIDAGDHSFQGREDEIIQKADWYRKLKENGIVSEIVAIAGNHDWLFEKEPLIARQIFKDVVYLEDSEVTINGLRIYGSPVTPFFCNWAFNRFRGEEIKRYWDNIPTGLDILLTHGPPEGILDLNQMGEKCGCEELFKAVMEKKPRYHCFGHIHGGYGIKTFIDTTFINASSCNEQYKPINPPILIEI